VKNGSVRGAQYQTSKTEAEVQALLTVGADGRLREYGSSGFEPVKTSPPMDVLWFKLPKLGADMEAGSGLMAPSAEGAFLWCSIASTTGRWDSSFPKVSTSK
jgi:hypothetical protein